MIGEEGALQVAIEEPFVECALDVRYVNRHAPIFEDASDALYLLAAVATYIYSVPVFDKCGEGFGDKVEVLMIERLRSLLERQGCRGGVCL